MPKLSSEQLTELTPQETRGVTRRNLLELWWTIPITGVLGFFVWFGLRSYSILLGKPAPGTPVFKPGLRLRIARASDLKIIWQAKDFDYPVKIGSTMLTTPAILIRTASLQPGGMTVGGAHFLALSKICTHLQCTCEYIVNPEIAAIAYQYRPIKHHPVLGCACHFSAFDPELAGKSVSGPALKALPRLQLEARAGDVFAVGIE